MHGVLIPIRKESFSNNILNFHKKHSIYYRTRKTKKTNVMYHFLVHVPNHKKEMYKQTKTRQPIATIEYTTY
jgi:hypothetical protein